MTPFLSSIRKWSPQYVFIATLLLGLLVVLLSLALNVFTFTARTPYVNAQITEREVGYAAAVNWSVTYTILFPITACLMIGILNKVHSVLHALEGQGMIRDVKNLRRKSADPFLHAWVAGTRFRKVLLIMLAVVFCLSGLAWVNGFRNNFLRLLHVGGPTAGPSDYDWGLATLMVKDSSLISRLANAFLDLLAFSCEGLMIGSVLAFFFTFDGSKPRSTSDDGRWPTNASFLIWRQRTIGVGLKFLKVCWSTCWRWFSSHTS